MHDTIAQLESLRRRGWVMLLLQRVAVVLAWIVAVSVALILLDYLLRLPMIARSILLAVGLATLAVLGWRYLHPVARFHPTLTQLALRVERALPALAGRLASSIEFAISGVDQTNTLAARTVRETQTRLAGESISDIIEMRSTVRDIAILLVVGLGATFFIVNDPASAQTGLLRLYVPFGDTTWPSRTGVESLMSEVVGERGVHPRGQALPLRARVTRGELAQRIDARYRVRSNDESVAVGAWQHVVLTQQGSSDIHERLIDVSSADEIEVYFTSQDDRTAVERISIVTPPAIRRASLTITPPEYAAGLVPPLAAELGTGTDSRARTEAASLLGSTVQLDLHLNKSIPVPAAASPREEWLNSTFDWSDSVEGEDADSDSILEFRADPDQPQLWALSWALDRTRLLPVHLIDEYGLTSSESIVYHIDAIADAPPSVTITEPQADEAVLASAIVPLAAEAQDDVGVADLALQARVARSADDQPAAQPIWSEEKDPERGQSVRIATDLDLSQLSLSEGDVLFITATALDVYEAADTERQAIVSPPRRLRIISELELETLVRRQLGAVRQNAIRMEAQQAELQELVDSEGASAESERAQAQLSERIAAQREAVDQLERQLRANRLEEPQLQSLLQQSADLLDFAGRASNQATAAMAEQRQRGETPEGQREITEQQQEVRAELSDLIELLDRDEDAWVVTRQLEGLMADQAQLQQDTADLGERTVGRSLAELPQEDLTELDRIAQRQRELRDRARELSEDMRNRADQLEEVDPQTAAGMRDAARTAEQRELDREMDRAAERAEQNQMRNAQQAQQAASDTMQRMLEDIEQTQRARAEQLLRELASLVQSIERLIVVQENELIALANARRRESFTGRDTAMIRLYQNTQAVAGEARSVGQETRRIARTLDRAADAQGTGIAALRARPLRVDDAEDAENRSLELLREAKALAEELEQQTQEEEAQRQRDELLSAYRAFAERQVVLRGQTLELQQAGQLDRRALVEARRLGSQQDEIRAGLLDLQKATQEIADSLIFSHVHSRIDGWSRAITEALDEGDVAEQVTDRQHLIAESIGHLIQALEEQSARPDEFDTGEGADQGAGNSSGGAPPLVPPIAELRLLRGMQEQVYNQTRELDARADLDEAARRERLRDVGAQQRELIDIGRRMMEAMGPPSNREPTGDARHE